MSFIFLGLKTAGDGLNRVPCYDLSLSLILCSLEVICLDPPLPLSEGVIVPLYRLRGISGLGRVRSILVPNLLSYIWGVAVPFR